MKSSYYHLRLFSIIACLIFFRGFNAIGNSYELLNYESHKVSHVDLKLTVHDASIATSESLTLGKSSASNDSQEGAIKIPHEANWCSAEGAYTTTGMTSKGKKISCSKDKKSRNDVWFKFQATSAYAEFEVSPSGTSPIGRIVTGLYSESLSELACARYAADNLPVKISYSTLTLGSWYYIRVDNGDKKDGDFSLCMKSVISYDYRAGAKEIPHTDDWCSAEGAYTTSRMSPKGKKISCAKDKESQNDVWVRFQATSEQVEVEVIPYGATPISKIAVGLYDDQENEITCARHTADILPVKIADDALIVGGWYYIRIDNAKNRTGDFTICMKNALGFDHQVAALEIPHTADWCSDDNAFTTIGMVPGEGKLSCAKDKESQNDVWFKFQADSEQVELEVIPTGSTPISKIAVGLYDDQGNEITCARHTADSLPVKIADDALIVGGWYYIRIDNAKDRAGDFTICIKNELGYDYQAGALEIPHTANWCSDDNAFTTIGMVPGEGKLSCAKDKESQNDVWFKFLANSEQVELEVIPTGSTPIGKIAVGLYDDLVNELACVRHFSDSLPVKVTYQALTIGNWYYVRVDNAKDRAGDFNLCIKNEISYDFQVGAKEIDHTTDWCSADGAYSTTGMTAGGKKISCSKDKESQNDVWFKFQASSEQVELEVIPTGATPISKIAFGLYDDLVNELACARHFSDNLPVKLAYQALTVGNWYYVRVDNAKQRAGDFKLCIKNEISYDFRVGAKEIQHTTDWCSADNAFTTIGMVPGEGKLSCAKGKENQSDVWFKFQATTKHVELEVKPTGATPIGRILVGIYDQDLREVACTQYSEDNLPVMASYTSLVLGNWYYIRIDNFIGSGGDFALCIREGDKVPEPPSDLVIENALLQNIQLTWADNSTIGDGFIIERRDNTADFLQLDTLAYKDSTQYLDSTIIEGNDYAYRVAAYNASGNSNFSNVDSLFIPITLPIAPTELNVSIGQNQNLLSWTDNAYNEDGYLIYYKTEFDTEYTIADTAVANITTFTDTLTHTGIDYSYFVVALNVAGVSDSTKISTVSVPLDVAREGQVPDLVEYRALKAIYESTNGPGWKNRKNWLDGNTSIDFEIWHGITIEKGDVTRLSLGNNMLTDDLPFKLGDLQSLDYLYLAVNNITSIPSSIGKLTKLNDLYLDKNNISILPKEIGELSNLMRLHLANNSISSIPSEFGDLSNLTHLYVSSNQLSGNIPTALTGLKNLSHLYLYQNKLSGAIPVELGGMTNLYALHLGDNQLSGSIPAELGGLANLMGLYLYSNQLTGSIPPELGGLTSLYTLYLNYNRLTGSIPVELGGLANLVDLHLDSNQLTGSIPRELGGLANLTDLYLNQNQLSGSIPIELGGLDNLNSLNLGDNQLGGSIPAELGQLTKLTYLHLNSNRLTDSIPSELGGVTNLKELDLSFNQLSGSIPSEMSDLSYLDDLIISYNKFTFQDIVGVTSWFSGTEYQYAPQDSIVIQENTEVGTGRSTSIIANVDRNTTPPSKYQWYRYVEEGTDIALMPTPTENGHSYTISSFALTDSGSYYFQVINDVAPDLTLYSKMTLVEPLTLPADPSDLSLSVRSNQIHLSWVDNSYNEDGYIIYGKTEFSNDYTIIDTAVTNITSFTDTLTHTGIDYSYFITAINQKGVSDSTKILTVSVPLDVAREGQVPDLVEYRALKAIYESTNGLDWKNRTNWLDGNTSIDFEIWHGVSIENGDVTRLSLGNNMLTGDLPSALGDLQSLDYLYLAVNNINSIPMAIGKLTNLNDFYLDNNNISILPKEIGELRNLTLVHLAHNSISSIPSEFGNLSKLTHLYFSSNQLSGNIPTALTRLAKLSHLYLYQNQLIGPIPPELGGMTNLYTLHLGENQLSGSIPAELGAMSNLMDLYLYSNQLSGAIPVELAELSNLYTLHLSYNQLSGSIPSELGGLANLMHLILGSNQLSGTIPIELGALTNLRNLDVRNNQLTGTIPSELGQLTNLVYVYFNSNQLTGDIPAELASLTGLYDLWIENNQFTFTDIIGIKSWFQGSRFNYIPQDSVDTGGNTMALINEPFSLIANVDRITTPPSKFQWFKCVKEGEDIALIPAPTSEGHTYTISSLAPTDSGSYYYQVINDMVPGLMLYSRRISVEPITLPAAPSGLEATVTSNQGHLSWVDNSDNEDGFIIERNENNSGFICLDTLSNQDGAQYVDAPLLMGNEYAYRVSAYKSKFASSWSNVSSFLIKYPVIPLVSEIASKNYYANIEYSKAYKKSYGPSNPGITTPSPSMSFYHVDYDYTCSDGLQSNGYNFPDEKFALVVTDSYGQIKVPNLLTSVISFRVESNCNKNFQLIDRSFYSWLNKFVAQQGIMNSSPNAVKTWYDNANQYKKSLLDSLLQNFGVNNYQILFNNCPAFLLNSTRHDPWSIVYEYHQPFDNSDKIIIGANKLRSNGGFAFKNVGYLKYVNLLVISRRSNVLNNSYSSKRYFKCFETTVQQWPMSRIDRKVADKGEVELDEIISVDSIAGASNYYFLITDSQGDTISMLKKHTNQFSFIELDTTVLIGKNYNVSVGSDIRGIHGPFSSPEPVVVLDIPVDEIVNNYDVIQYVRMSGNDTLATSNDIYNSFANPSVASVKAHTLSKTDTVKYLVYVQKGTYHDYWVTMPGIDIYFEDDAVVWYNSDSEKIRSIISDRRGGPGDYKVLGKGRFYVTTVNGAYDKDAINFMHNSSLEIEVKEFSSFQFWKYFNSPITISNATILTTEVWNHNTIKGSDITFNNCVFRMGYRAKYEKGTVFTFNDCTFILPDLSEVDEALKVVDHNNEFLFTTQIAYPSINKFDYRLNTEELSHQQIADIGYERYHDSLYVVSSFEIHRAENPWRGWQQLYFDFAYKINNPTFIINRPNCIALRVVWEENNTDIDYTDEGIEIIGGQAIAGPNGTNAVFIQADKKDSLAADIPITLSNTSYEEFIERVVRTGYFPMNISGGNEGTIPDLEEAQALSNLHKALLGDQWISDAHWLSGNSSLDFSVWKGVVVTNGDVTEIRLPANNLKGNLPADLNALGRLEVFDVGSNKIKGDISIQLARIESLEELYLNNNQISGYMDLEFSIMPKIQVMHLQENEFVSIPDFSFSPIDDLSMVTLKAENNKLEFYYIENNLNANGTDILGTFTYMPQKEYGEPRIAGFIKDKELKLTLKMPGRENHYQWQFSADQGQTWSDEGIDDPELLIANVDDGDEGWYRVRITNDRADEPEDEIMSAVYTVRIEAAPKLVNLPID